jgi:TonB family protein
MLKRVLLASVLAAGAAHAEDTKPMLQSISECDMPYHFEPQEVKLAFTVTETGTVADIRVVQSSGNAEADERVEKCVSKYTYKPATHDGAPVAHPETFTFHSALIEDIEGERKAYALLERDADRRCHKLYPIDRNFFDSTRPISLVVVTRQTPGEVQMTVTQSAGEKADRNAIACLKELLKDHNDLPASFSRAIAIDWLHRW